MLRVKDNSKRIQKKVQAARQQFSRDVPETVKEQIEVAEGFAKAIVPYDKGYLFKALTSRVESSKGSVQRGVLEVNQSVIFTAPSNRRRTDPFDYATYMHINHGNLARGKIVSGDPRFMETTREFMEDQFGVAIRTRLRTALGRFGQGFK